MNQKPDLRNQKSDQAKLNGFRFLISALIFLVGFTVSAFAQTSDDASIFEVTDVAVDITADSAAHARDQAIAEAQRTALEQLLGRLGTDAALAARLDDDSLSALVQHFEVQNERTSSVRYIGVFTVQFRPIATRDWLTKNGATFTETRSKPVIVLPVFANNGHPVLWEERTKWRTVWDNARNTGLVPIIVPQGGLDDIAVVSADEAIKGDGGALKALAEKYQAGGTVVAVLDGDLDNPGPAFKITVTPYDAQGTAGDPVYLNLQPAADKASIDNALAQAVTQVHTILEGDWRQEVAKTAQVPSARLAVTVPISTLDEWALIKNKLNNVRDIDRTNLLTLARGATSIELEFHGDIEQLRDDLSKQNLALTQDVMGAWILQLAAPGAAL
jgi:hypothetical protein